MVKKKLLERVDIEQTMTYDGPMMNEHTGDTIMMKLNLRLTRNSTLLVGNHADVVAMSEWVMNNTNHTNVRERGIVIAGMFFGIMTSSAA